MHEALSNEIQSMNFSKYGDFIVRNERIEIQVAEIQVAQNWIGNGYVYLWIKTDKDNSQIVYVGKAGKTLKARFTQHLAGFHGSSKTGMRHSKNLVNEINTGACFEIFARKSSSINLFGVEDVCMQSVEEEALIAKYKPGWNTQK